MKKGSLEHLCLFPFTSFLCCSVRRFKWFSDKLLMDCVLLLLIMQAVLAAHAATENISNSSSNPSSVSTTTNFSSELPCATYKTNIVTTPVVGRIKVEWTKTCSGHIKFDVNFTWESFYLCSDKIINEGLAKELCEERRCGKLISFKSSESDHGYMIHENLTTSPNIKCNRTYITCKDVVKASKELVIYKVLTGLLLTLIAVVLLCRFAQPTYIAVHKRFSQKRQNRWVGPTQSQSVSYQRGQGGHPNNNTMNRHSYPGLDRLTVNPSREPSSNRNSDYDSYGF